MESNEPENSIEKEPDNGGLARGFPCGIALKKAAKMLADAHAEMMNKDFADIFPIVEYGDQEGNEEVRAAFSTFLTEEYGERVPKSEIFICGGASLSLYLIGQVVVPPRCKFLIEEVTYLFGMSTIDADLKREMLPVKCSPDGVDLEDLENILKREYENCPDKDPFSCAFYVLPTFHNPRGISYSPENSEGIVKLAKKYKALIISDDVYAMLYFEKESQPRRLRSFAIEHNCADYVVSLGSFSKICAPGLRLGWIECSLNIYNVLGNLQTLQSGCNLGHYQSYIMKQAMENGSLKSHLKFLRQLYQERANYVISNIIPHLPTGSVHSVAKGGFYIWVELPDKYNTTRFWEISMNVYGLAFHKGERFSAVGGHSNCLRLTYSALTMPELKVAVSKFVAALKTYLKEVDGA